jgi:threonyl-tRNA synthetase
LIDMIKEQIEGKPVLPINLPEYLSKRPKIAS